MFIRMISGSLILFSAIMGTKHGWSLLNIKPGHAGPVADLLLTLNLSQPTLKLFSILTILGGFLLLPPQTFLAGNLLNICLFLFLIIRFLIAGDIKHALSEISFLLVPVVLIFLKHPLAG
ncbi:hypothetical protein SAMN05443550_105213 [Pedobacter hartonius]|uniref:DoxX-like family protein n=2 Tax=Pedobacter hartonius TaxID=425514 RepID=A0A1H4E274_9SPHI|nr:hypothetical protein SAMN05443550_105213 [Pedobacter hartonius]